MFLLTILVLIAPIYADYWKDRQNLIDSDDAHAVGAEQVLNEIEIKINNWLLERKRDEYDYGFQYPKAFLASRHFFEVKNEIEQSDVFKFIQRLPKGGSLHSHDTSQVSSEFLFGLTYRDNLYACTEDNRVKLYFFKPPILNQNCDWELVSDLRKRNESYDAWLRSQLTLVVENPNEAYPDIDTVWNTFMGIFKSVVPMLSYKPIFEEYLYEVIKEYYSDNIMYFEFRSTIPPLYDLDGTTYTQLETVGVYKAVIEKFKATHTDFLGAKLIYGPNRHVSNNVMSNYASTVQSLKRTYPKFMAGFDLVGQEDLGYPLKNFVDDLKTISNDTNVFFHAGETNWYGTSTDLNLFDAVLLGTKRIGHGYALVKHPELMGRVKKQQIGIEIAPISNQVLKLVDDMRNHAGSTMIANGLPVIICNDDPSFWGAKGLSYDWYMAFMGLASRNADLRFLKQIAINSIIYSSMDREEMKNALQIWNDNWFDYLNNTLLTATNVIN